MPRLSITLIKKARSLHPLLPLLLRPCRDLQLARNELRWLAEYQRNLIVPAAAGSRTDGISIKRRRRQRIVPIPTLQDLCRERATGRPLQYILGTQPFGNLDILCRRGVLIPRSETESSVLRLAQALIDRQASRQPATGGERPQLRILDLGTGTGCMLLLLVARLQPLFRVDAVGIDISPLALNLARRNLQRNLATGAISPDPALRISFRQQDMNSADFQTGTEAYDVVLSNPPYITSEEFRRSTERSVRIFEPRLALLADKVPSVGYTSFEATILSLIQRDKAAVTLVEFVDAAKARDFAKWGICKLMIGEDDRFCHFMIWRDQVTQRKIRTCEGLLDCDEETLRTLRSRGGTDPSECVDNTIVPIKPFSRDVDRLSYTGNFKRPTSSVVGEPDSLERPAKRGIGPIVIEIEEGLEPWTAVVNQIQPLGKSGRSGSPGTIRPRGT